MSKEFSVEQLQNLMECVAQNHIEEFLFETENIKLRIRGEKEQPMIMPHTVQMPVAAPMPVEFVAQSATSQPAMGMVGTVVEDIEKLVTSPIVGTFYAASGPEKDPFAVVGQKVKEGDTVFIIESMKVMNEVPSDKSGVIAEILVVNGEAVEYGQPILRLE